MYHRKPPLYEDFRGGMMQQRKFTKYTQNSSKINANHTAEVI